MHEGLIRRKLYAILQLCSSSQKKVKREQADGRTETAKYVRYMMYELDIKLILFVFRPGCKDHVRPHFPNHHAGGL